MKGKYKSPKKALFYSLLVPGTGQIYVGGGTGNYMRGAVYLATEAVLGGLWYHYCVTLYNRQVKRYKAFANEHFSLGKYEQEMYSLYISLADNTKEGNFSTLYLSDRSKYCESIYGDADKYDCSDSTLSSTNHRNYVGSATETLGDFIDSTGGLWDASTLYLLIADENYVLGWDDVTDQTAAEDLILSTTDSSTWVALGTSDNQDIYQSMRDRANRLAGYQVYFLGGILLNHLVSAIDATLAARAHNKALYEERLTWADRLHFNSQLYWTGDWTTRLLAYVEF